jgi:hypothetical protein
MVFHYLVVLRKHPGTPILIFLHHIITGSFFDIIQSLPLPWNTFGSLRVRSSFLRSILDSALALCGLLRVDIQ